MFQNLPTNDSSNQSPASGQGLTNDFSSASLKVSAPTQQEVRSSVERYRKTLNPDPANPNRTLKPGFREGYGNSPGASAAMVVEVSSWLQVPRILQLMEHAAKKNDGTRVRLKFPAPVAGTVEEQKLIRMEQTQIRELLRNASERTIAELRTAAAPRIDSSASFLEGKASGLIPPRATGTQWIDAHGITATNDTVIHATEIVRPGGDLLSPRLELELRLKEAARNSGTIALWIPDGEDSLSKTLAALKLLLAEERFPADLRKRLESGALRIWVGPQERDILADPKKYTRLREMFFSTELMGHVLGKATQDQGAQRSSEAANDLAEQLDASRADSAAKNDSDPELARMRREHDKLNSDLAQLKGAPEEIANENLEQLRAREDAMRKQLDDLHKKLETNDEQISHGRKTQREMEEAADKLKARLKALSKTAKDLEEAQAASDAATQELEKHNGDLEQMESAVRSIENETARLAKELQKLGEEREAQESALEKDRAEKIRAAEEQQALLEDSIRARSAELEKAGTKSAYANQLAIARKFDGISEADLDKPLEELSLEC